MATTTAYLLRHEYEAQLLQRALQGEPAAIKDVLLYLSSPDPDERLAMSDTIHDFSTPELWRHLLRCLAVWCWEDRRDTDLRMNQEASQRIDQSITELFIQDEFDGEAGIKELILEQALQNDVDEIRYAATFLMGLRGEKEMITPLVKMLQKAPKVWRVRSAIALGALDDERCALPLIEALATDRGTLHNACRHALEQLGPNAKIAWRGALNHPDRHVRWHAARSLGDYSDQRTLEVLTEGLLDENNEVRWITANALARTGASALPAILQLLSRAPVSNPTRQAVLFALHGCLNRGNRPLLKPLIEVLQSPMTSGEVPPIAAQLIVEV